MRCTSGLLTAIDWQIFLRIVVLPALGGETIKPRWPLPMGLTMSIARPVMESLPCSILSGSLGYTGVRSENLGRCLTSSGSKPLIERSLASPGSLSFARDGAKRAGDQVAGAQPGGANQLRGNEGVVAAGHVSVNADVAEPLIVNVEDALDVAEPLGLRSGRVHDLDQLGLLDARGVELELAGLLAQLRDLHRGEFLAREGGLGRGEPVVALLAVLLLALTALTARIRLGGGLVTAVGALPAIGALAVATGLMAATGLLAPDFAASAGSAAPVAARSGSAAGATSSAAFLARDPRPGRTLRLGSAGASGPAGERDSTASAAASAA